MNYDTFLRQLDLTDIDRTSGLIKGFCKETGLSYHTVTGWSKSRSGQVPELAASWVKQRIELTTQRDINHRLVGCLQQIQQLTNNNIDQIDRRKHDKN